MTCVKSLFVGEFDFGQIDTCYHNVMKEAARIVCDIYTGSCTKVCILLLTTRIACSESFQLNLRSVRTWETVNFIKLFSFSFTLRAQDHGHS